MAEINQTKLAIATIRLLINSNAQIAHQESGGITDEYIIGDREKKHLTKSPPLLAIKRRTVVSKTIDMITLYKKRQILAFFNFLLMFWRLPTIPA